jgi:hypothetical protein
MNENTISLQLGREELVTLLNLIGARGMVGIGDDFLADYSDREKTILLTAGANALRAKGWLREGENEDNVELRVDQTLLAMLGTCMMASRIFFFNYLPADAPYQPWYVHLDTEMSVIHRTVMPGVHELTGCIDREVVREIINARLGIADAPPAPGIAPFVIEDAEFDRLTMLLREGDAAGAEAVLTAVGLLPETRAVVLQALEAVVANTMMSLLEVVGEEVRPLSTISLLQTASGWWRIDALNNSEPVKMRFSPVDTAGVQGHLAEVLELN